MSRWLNKNSNTTWDQLLTAVDKLPAISEFASTSGIQGKYPLVYVHIRT